MIFEEGKKVFTFFCVHMACFSLLKTTACGFLVPNQGYGTLACRDTVRAVSTVIGDYPSLQLF
uniref:Uncharacterized protein n=1 Tax=Anguilla anguilla TaxID=7936 RepID=A0A0E9UM47_ANGAN